MFVQSEERLIRGYLLGELDGKARADVDERVLQDDAFLERVQSVEDELITEYVAGDLDQAQRARFEQHFLVSADRRQRLELAEMLRARDAATQQPVRRYTARGVLHAWWQWELAAAAVVVLAVVTWRLAMPPTPIATAPPITHTTPVPREPIPPPPRVFAVTLTAGTLRDVEPAKPVVVPDNIDIVQLRLPLTTARSYPEYRVTIENPDAPVNRIVWTSSPLPAASVSDGALTVDIPATALKRGDYVVVVRADRSQSPPVDEYVLQVR